MDFQICATKGNDYLKGRSIIHVNWSLRLFITLIKDENEMLSIQPERFLATEWTKKTYMIPNETSTCIKFYENWLR